MIASTLNSVTHWWFWIALPFAVAASLLLDKGLSAYSRRYWRKRGQTQPPHRYSYLDAGRLVIYASLAAYLTVVLLLEHNYLGAAALACGAAVFTWFALARARRNII